MPSPTATGRVRPSAPASADVLAPRVSSPPAAGSVAASQVNSSPADGRATGEVHYLATHLVVHRVCSFVSTLSSRSTNMIVFAILLSASVTFLTQQLGGGLSKFSEEYLFGGSTVA